MPRTKVAIIPGMTSLAKSLYTQAILVGEYNGTASSEGYTLKDGTKLNLSDKYQKWVGVKDTFKF